MPSLLTKSAYSLLVIAALVGPHYQSFAAFRDTDDFRVSAASGDRYLDEYLKLTAQQSAGCYRAYVSGLSDRYWFDNGRLAASSIRQLASTSLANGWMNVPALLRTFYDEEAMAERVRERSWRTRFRKAFYQWMSTDSEARRGAAVARLTNARASLEQAVIGELQLGQSEMLSMVTSPSIEAIRQISLTSAARTSTPDVRLTVTVRDSGGSEHHWRVVASVAPRFVSTKLEGKWLADFLLLARDSQNQSVGHRGRYLRQGAPLSIMPRSLVFMVGVDVRVDSMSEKDRGAWASRMSQLANHEVLLSTDESQLTLRELRPRTTTDTSGALIFSARLRSPILRAVIGEVSVPSKICGDSRD
jgi:uncharacterized protein YdaU (DUF1376 family)